MVWPPEPGKDLNSFGGDYSAYLDACYEIYWNDFYTTRPNWPDGKRFSIKRNPVYDDKCGTFWHITTEGEDEADRLPDLSRLERIAWPRLLIDDFCEGYPAPSTGRTVWWKSLRGSNDRVLIALADFTYVVVITERADYVMLWTAYPVPFTSRQRKLEREWRNYWDSQGVQP